MKSLRLFVLVLLALLLPLQGATAAVQRCAQHSSQGEQVVVGHEHGPSAEATSSAPAPTVHDHGASDEERHCLASCLSASLMTALSSVALATLTGTIAFPHFAASAPAFESGGPDRPPRRL